MRIRHGGELRQFAEKLGIPERNILDFSSNINPWGPPDSVKKAYQENVETIQHYPDPEALEFRREVARHYPLWPENVIAGNGAAELLDSIVRLLRPKKALLIEPTFLEYRRLLNLQGTEIRSVLLREKDDFQLAVPEVINALQGVEVAIFVQPNNPTGGLIEKEILQKLLSEVRRRNIFVVLDEAFIDWTPHATMAREVRDDSHFFVIRSLTKFFSLPGIRAGYGLGSRKLIEKLATHQVPWSCNRLAQKLGIVALRDQEFIKESLEWLVKEREDFKIRLQEIPSLKVYPSAANFLLIRQGGRPSLLQDLGERGIYVRDLTDFPGLGAGYFRVAVRKQEENNRLVEALANVSPPAMTKNNQ